MTSMKHFRVAILATACALAGTLSPAADAQTPPTDDSETSPVVAAPPTTGPVSIPWMYKNGLGKLNLLLNPDGTYLFSGNSTGHKPGKEIDVAMALKASTGGVLLFHYVGDASNGAQWSNQGQSMLLQDDWTQFAKGHPWSASTTTRRLQAFVRSCTPRATAPPSARQRAVQIGAVGAFVATGSWLSVQSVPRKTGEGT